MWQLLIRQEAPPAQLIMTLPKELRKSCLDKTGQEEGMHSSQQNDEFPRNQSMEKIFFSSGEGVIF